MVARVGFCFIIIGYLSTVFDVIIAHLRETFTKGGAIIRMRGGGGIGNVSVAL